MLQGFIRGLTEIMYPKLCLSCKNKLDASSANDYICSRCWLKIKKNTPPFCHSCGRHLEKNNPIKNICPGCLKRKFNFDRAFSPCAYEGVIKDLIHEFKYNGKTHLGQPLGRIMTGFIREYRLPIDYLDMIIPVPLYKTRLRQREFNQAEVLGRHIAEEFKKILEPDALIRLRQTKTQTELAPEERFLNVKASFAADAGVDLKMKNLLVVDDVLTTGATSSEAARALKNAGANIVFILTLAN